MKTLLVRFNPNFRTLTTVIRDEENWEPAESVTLRTYYGDGDRRKIISLLSEYRQNPDGSLTTISTIDRAYTARRVLAISSWTLKDESGKALPLNEEIVANLPPYVASFIDAEIDKHWSDLLAPPKSKDEEKEAAGERQTFSGPAASAAGGQEDRVADSDAARARASRRSRTAPTA